MFNSEERFHQSSDEIAATNQFGCHFHDNVSVSHVLPGHPENEGVTAQLIMRSFVVGEICGRAACQHVGWVETADLLGPQGTSTTAQPRALHSTHTHPIWESLHILNRQV
jgi:hypothetical protein